MFRRKDRVAGASLARGSSSVAAGLPGDPMGQPVARLVPVLLLLLPKRGGESPTLCSALLAGGVGGACVWWAVHAGPRGVPCLCASDIPCVMGDGR